MNSDSILKLAHDTPYYGHLGIQLVTLEPGFAKLTLPFKADLTHPFGYFHGGAIASLADSAGINAVMTTLKDSESAVTLEMKINFCSPAKDDDAVAQAKVIHKGKRVAISDVEIHNSAGMLIAKAIITCAIL
jgi:uncharacterized protein (TIGR00369 family)